MRNEHRSHSPVGCVVCGVTDARALSYTRLADGTRLTVCGSHKIAHRRADRIATSVAELRVLIGERRACRDTG